MDLEYSQYYLDKLSKMGNNELWEEFLMAQIEDGYDGFSTKGAFQQKQSRKEIEKRLAAIGFLKN